MSWIKNSATRFRIYRSLRKRDGDTCQICRRPIDFRLRGTGTLTSPSIDHFVPRSAGGSDRLPNLRLTHLYCNMNRGTADWYPLDGAR